MQNQQLCWELTTLVIVQHGEGLEDKDDTVKEQVVEEMKITDTTITTASTRAVVLRFGERHYE